MEKTATHKVFEKEFKDKWMNEGYDQKVKEAYKQSLSAKSVSGLPK